MVDKYKNILIYCLSGLLFLACFRFGLLLAEHKELWNDELYSQTFSVKQNSYKDMFIGKIKEGNLCPLFYSIQKVICQLAQYETPDLWKSQNVYDRILLRLNPVFFMSLSIACIFFYFSHFYSLGIGVYSLFIAASSFMIWSYWAEARPYNLWFFLTTIQSLIFLYLVSEKRKDSKGWFFLIIVHLLLSLTVVFSLAQIVIVSVLLWLFIDKRWQKYISLTMIPSAIALFYYFNSPKYQFQFGLTSEQLIRDCFSRDRFYILFIFLFFLAIFFLQKRWKYLKVFKDDELLKGIPYLSATIMMLLASFLILFIFKYKETPGEGFHIASRYFIYLTPISIIATTLLSRSIFIGLSTNRWIQVLVTSGMGYLIIHRFWKMTFHIKSVCSIIS